jgi:hypothetical protein
MTAVCAPAGMFYASSTGNPQLGLADNFNMAGSLRVAAMAWFCSSNE